MISAHVKNQTRASVVLRIIALLLMFASTIPFTFLLFKLSEAASAVAIFMLPGPLLIIAGIAVSFFSSKRPALLRLEIAFGLLFTYTAGIFSIFSIGGILLLGLLASVPALIIDSILLRPTYSKREKRQTSFAQNILIIIFQLILSALFLFLIANVAIGFLSLIAPFIIVWNVLLFYSVRSYLLLK